MTANPPSCSAAPGMPSEETIREIVGDALNSAIAEPWEVSAHATQRILALIRPAFEAKDAEIARLKALPVIADYIEVQDARRAAEAKLAQAVEALRKAKVFHDRDSGLNGFTADYECLRLEIDEAVAANEPAASAAARGETT